MTEERLKEIKDSIDFQLDVCKITKQELPNILAIEEKELYDEVIRLQQENERLKEELNNHIKEGIEKDIRINNELKNDLMYVLEQLDGYLDKGWTIDLNFTDIREKYKEDIKEYENWKW